MIISVIGDSACDKKIYAAAEEVGKLIALEGALLITGGLGGVMEAACKEHNRQVVRQSAYCPALAKKMQTGLSTSRLLPVSAMREISLLRALQTR